MAWVRIDDQAPRHHKMLKAGPEACWLWVCGIAHCQSLLTDGVITTEALPMIGVPGKARALRLAEILVDAGLFDKIDGGYRVHDYHDFNLTADEARKKLDDTHEAKVRAGRAGGRRSGEVRKAAKQRSRTEACASEAAKQNEADGTKQNEAPSHPIPSEYEKDTSAAASPLAPITATSLAWFDRVYAIYPNKDRKQEAHRTWVQLAPDEALAARIYRAIDTRVKAGWRKYERRFIPQLRNYLAERMWEDADAPDVGPVFEDDPYASFPEAWTCRICGEVHEAPREQAKRRPCLKKEPA